MPFVLESPPAGFDGTGATAPGAAQPVVTVVAAPQNPHEPTEISKLNLKGDPRFVPMYTPPDGDHEMLRSGARAPRAPPTVRPYTAARF